MRIDQHYGARASFPARAPRAFLAIVTLVLLAVTTAAAVSHPEAQPIAAASAAAPLVRLAAVDAIIEQAIADGNIPGAVLIVGHNGKVVYRKAYGCRALEPKREPMTLDTVFDLASLTKVIATTTAVMQLVELGKVRLNDPVAKYPPQRGVDRAQPVPEDDLGGRC